MGRLCWEPAISQTVKSASSNGFTITGNPSLTGYPLAIGDLNNDGKMDVLSVDSGNSIVSLLGNGDGTFTKASGSYSQNLVYQAAVADFNLDGKPDVVYSSGQSYVNVLLGTGNGSFQPAPPVTAGSQTELFR